MRFHDCFIWRRFCFSKIEPVWFPNKCVNRTHNSARSLPINGYQRSQTIPACLHKSSKCWTFARCCEACAAICCNMLWLQPMETENAGCRKDFLHSGKKSMTKEWFHNNDFRDVAVYNSIPDALRDLHTSKCKRPHNRPYDACLWNWQNAIKFAWANKSNLLRALKNLMETKLNKRAVDGNSCSTIYLIFVL